MADVKTCVNLVNSEKYLTVTSISSMATTQLLLIATGGLRKIQLVEVYFVMCLKVILIDLQYGKTRRSANVRFVHVKAIS